MGLCGEPRLRPTTPASSRASGWHSLPGSCLPSRGNQPQGSTCIWVEAVSTDFLPSVPNSLLCVETKLEMDLFALQVFLLGFHRPSTAACQCLRWLSSAQTHQQHNDKTHQQQHPGARGSSCSPRASPAFLPKTFPAATLPISPCSSYPEVPIRLPSAPKAAVSQQSMSK